MAEHRIAKIFNATLHPPTREQAEAGVGAPCGRIVPLTAAFEEIEKLGATVVDEAVQEGAEAILLGGLTSFCIAVYEAARARGLPVLEALTERIHDENGRFVFVHRGFRKIEPGRR